MNPRHTLLASLALLAATVSVAAADELTDRLEALPGVTVISDRSVDELAAIVAARSRWQLVDGRLELRPR